MYNTHTMNPKKKAPQPKKVPNILNQILIAVFIFISITIIYSMVSKPPVEVKNMTISDVAQSVVEGKVEKI